MGRGMPGPSQRRGRHALAAAEGDRPPLAYLVRPSTGKLSTASLAEKKRRPAPASDTWMPRCMTVQGQEGVAIASGGINDVEVPPSCSG